MSEPKTTRSVIEDWYMWMPEEIQRQNGKRDLPLKEFTKALEDAATRSGKHHLGWSVGASCNYLSRGIFGKAVMSAKTLGVGLHWLSRFYPLIQDATRVKLEVHDDVATLSYRITDPNIWPREQDALYSLSIFANFIRKAAPGIWPQVSIRLEAAKSADNRELGHYIQAPISYGANANEIVFPAKCLSNRIEGVEPVSSEEMTQLNRCLAAKNRSIPICDRARYVIYSGLMETTVSQEYVARELGYSSRTLRRKLSSVGLSYQSLLDVCRMEVAAREIAVTEHISFSQMALKLGYSEHSTFTRAFSRWSGMTPRRYRSICSESVVAA